MNTDAKSTTTLHPLPLAKPLQRARDEATRCIQCGFCLPACPTYKVFGEEKHSPRGRIQLVKAWAENDAALTADLLTALDLCLDCRACETACPIDVQYGRIITGARDALAEGGTAPKLSGPPETPATPATSATTAPSATAEAPVPLPTRGPLFRWTLRHIAAVPKRLRFVTRTGHRLLHSRLGHWMQRQIEGRADGWFASALTFARALPYPEAPRAQRTGWPTTHGPNPSQGCDSSVAVFLGCAQEGMFPETNTATAALLHEAGYTVSVPAEQGCCGALHRHHGDKAFARQLVVGNLHAFDAWDESRHDPIVMNAGGCMAWLRESAELFAPGTKEHEAARRLAARVKDISEMVNVLSETASGQTVKVPGQTESDTGRAEAPNKQNLRVVYQPSCHLTNVCGIHDKPLAALQQLTGGCATLPPDGGSCCGSAGIYNALHPKASQSILNAKMKDIAHDPPDVIVTSNPGCHLQMRAGVEAHGLAHKVRVVQWADFVHEFRGEGESSGSPGAIPNDLEERTPAAVDKEPGARDDAANARTERSHLA